MSKKISPERKKLYNAGLVLIIIGLCLFSVPFLAFPLGFCGFSVGREWLLLGIPFAFVAALIGFPLVVIGGIMRVIAARGVAGSGLILDPEKAREDLEPWSRMGGGIVKDALDEADIDLKNLGGGDCQPEKVIMIKCRECGKLNEEDSKFCQECGKVI